MGSPRPILLKPSPNSPKTPDSPSSPAAQSAGPRRLSVSKNYVIPPRPKPGRKPSTEVPPSRRKAQNREAQRAFRERRSHIVRALEDQLAQQARDFEKQQQYMREQIASLQGQPVPSYSFSGPGSQSQPQYPPQSVPQLPHSLQSSNALAQSPQSLQSPPGLQSSQTLPPPQIAPPQIAYTQPSPTAVLPQFALSPPAVATPYYAAPSPGYYLASSPASPASSYSAPVTPADVVGQDLLDHVLEQKLPTDQTRERRPSRTMRRPSQSSPKSKGVTRTDPPPAESPLDLVTTNWSQPAVPLPRKSRALETDFTQAFMPITPKSPKPLPNLRDRCGFCTDSTPCVCAESAMREQNSDLASDVYSAGNSPKSTPASLGSPLGFNEETTSANGTQTNSNCGGCTGNPSNCTQCQLDPMLTLFCSAISSKPPTAKQGGTYIPTQAAYKTLARHPGFANADLGEVVDALLVKSSQIEVNSVAKVLRMLDARSA